MEQKLTLSILVKSCTFKRRPRSARKPESSEHVVLIRALQAFRGIGFVTAVTIVAEAGELASFPNRTAVHGLRGCRTVRKFQWQQTAPRSHHQNRQQLAAARLWRGCASRPPCPAHWRYA